MHDTTDRPHQTPSSSVAITDAATPPAPTPAPIASWLLSVVAATLVALADRLRHVGSRAHRAIELGVFLMLAILGATVGWKAPELIALLSRPILALLCGAGAIGIALVAALAITWRNDAFRDPLTSLFTKRVLQIELARASARSSRGRGRPVFLMMIDLDRFKRVNDTLGHRAGDALLVAVARRMEECLRPADLLARWGLGDEFVVLGELDSPATPVALVARIREAITRPVTVASVSVTVGASIGLAVTGEGEPFNVNDLIARADAAMYAEKHSSRKRTR